MPTATEKIDTNLIKAVESNIFRNRASKVLDEVEKLKTALKAQKKLALKKADEEGLTRSDDSTGKQKLAKGAKDALKNLQLELETVKKAMKGLEEIHKHLSNVTKDWHQLAGTFEKAAKAQP